MNNVSKNIHEAALNACLEQEDYVQAAALCRKAAEQGYAPAQTNLGLMYRLGKGVALDYKEALAWYHKAAEQGFAQAQASLGCMYREGWGVKKDETQAAKWFHEAGLDASKLV